jgi:acetolactate synthase-1/2/3 large subunit
VPSVTGAQLLLRSLRAEDVEIVFTLSGTAILGVYDRCSEEGIRLIDGRHEAAVVHMAEGYARAMAQPGVALVTEGPGHANAMPGLACAFAENSPVLLISGVADSQGLGRGAQQELPQVEMAAPLTKWSALVPSAERIPEYVAKAFRCLRSGEPGPVHLSIPTDLLDDDLVDERAAPILGSRKLGATAGSGVAPSLIEQAVARLAAAERPAIIAGNTAYWSQAGSALQAFVELTKIPLFTTTRARGLVSDAHPQCFGAFPTTGPTATLLNDADVLLILGHRLDYATERLLPQSSIIHVYPDPVEVGKNRPVALGLAADVDVALAQLADAARARAWRDGDPWRQALHDARAERRVRRLDRAPGGAPVHPLQVGKAVEPLLGEADFLITEMSNFVWWSVDYLECHRPGRWQQSTALYMLGTGLGYALGAKAAFPDARVLLLAGDGSFGFYPMELDTAVRHGLPIVVVVGNDGAWGIEQSFQAARFGEDRLVATDLLATRYDRLVEALGGHGELVERPDELAGALERAFASGKPACVNVVVDSVLPPALATYVASLERQRLILDD